MDTRLRKERLRDCFDRCRSNPSATNADRLARATVDFAATSLAGVSGDDREDVLQEVAIRTWQAAAGDRPVRDPVPWVRQVLRNVFMDVLRAQYRWPPSITDEVEPPGPRERGPDSIVEARDEFDAAVAKARLTAGQERVLRLRVEGHRPREIAALCGRSRGAVRQELLRIRQALAPVYRSAS